MYFVLFCFISHPSLVRISKVLCAFSWIHNDSWTLYLKCTFFFFFLCYCALFDFRMEFVEKKKFQIKVQLWHQKCTDFRYKTSCRLKQNKWLLGDIECICKMATDGPIQFSSHLSVSSTPAMCVCWIYCYALSVVRFLFCSAKWRWKLQFSRRINLLRFYLHAWCISNVGRNEFNAYTLLCNIAFYMYPFIYFFCRLSR